MKIEINEVHVKAFAALTGKWKRLPDLKRQTGLGWNAFDDLRVLGFAQEKRETITRSGIACGENVSYRLIPAMARCKRHILSGSSVGAP